MSELRHFRFSGYSSTYQLARIVRRLADLAERGLELEDVTLRSYYGFSTCDVVLRADPASDLLDAVAEVLERNALSVPQLSNTKIFQLRKRFEANRDSRLRVLLIDDEADTLEPALRAAGQAAGWDITWHVATNREEALAKLFQVDLILLDIMFEKEVHDATTSLRILAAISEDVHRRPPVFVISVYPSWEDEVLSQYWSLGAWRFVSKHALIERGGLGMLLSTLLERDTRELTVILSAEEPLNLLATTLVEAAEQFAQVSEISTMRPSRGGAPRVVLRLSASDSVRPEELLECLARRVARPEEGYATEAILREKDLAGDSRLAIGQRAHRWLACLEDPSCPRQARLAAQVALEGNVRVHSWEIYRQLHSL